MNNALLRPVLHRTLSSLLLSLAVLAPALAADWDIDQLMQSLAKTKSGRATFVEKKTIAMIDRPVESSGELLYTAPDKLEKRTIKPKPETLLVDGDVLTMERGRQKLTVQLRDYPELAGFIDSIRGTLAGDRKALEHSFRLKLDGPATRWMLTLWPTDAKMARSVHLIRIIGNRDALSSIEVIQTDGDRSLMLIQQAAAQ